MQRLYLVLGTINNILLEIMQITGMFQCKGCQKCYIWRDMFLDGQWNAVALANQGEIQPWHIQLPVKSGAYLTTKLQDSTSYPLFSGKLSKD